MLKVIEDIKFGTEGVIIQVKHWDAFRKTAYFANLKIYRIGVAVHFEDSADSWNWHFRHLADACKFMDWVAGIEVSK